MNESETNKMSVGAELLFASRLTDKAVDAAAAGFRNEAIYNALFVGRCCPFLGHSENEGETTPHHENASSNEPVPVHCSEQRIEDRRNLLQSAGNL